MKIAIIIPVHNRKNETLACLKQLANIDRCEHVIDIIIVDDGSTDNTGEAIRQLYPEVIIVKGDGNLWWTGAINVGVKYALDHAYEYVLLLNDDLVYEKSFLCKLTAIAENRKQALVSSLKLFKMDNSNPTIITAGFRTKGYFKEITNTMQGEVYETDEMEDILEREILTGASLLIPCKVFTDIGIFDYDRFPHNWGDLEFTWRAHLKGYECLVSTKSHVYGEFNPNYHKTYIVNATRLDYLKNLFDDRKFSYGFKFLYHKAYMHRTFVMGTIIYIKGMVGLLRNVLIKTVFPTSLIKLYMGNDK